MIAEEVRNMKEATGVRDAAETGDGAMEAMRRALHDLCQPLTTLQCRLELAEMTGTEESYHEAVCLGLAECLRLVKAVGSMRDIVSSTQQPNRGNGGTSSSASVSRQRTC